MKFETRAIHDGQPSDQSTGAVIVPVYQTSTYQQEGIGKHQGYEYSRTGNPTRQALEDSLASLEGGRYGLAFASGLAAETAVLSLLQSGDHIVSGNDIYGGTFRLFEKIYRPLGIEATYVEATDVQAFEKAIKPATKLIWVETPTNPLLKLADIRALAEIAENENVILVVDNTFASPYFQRPLEHGADIIVHSTTKYLAGHSDLIGGAIITSSESVYQRIKFYQNAAGAIPGPWDAWLTLRGIKTLAVRMREHEKNALRLAKLLQNHPKVDKVYYPGLPEHQQHELAKTQMSGFGGMVSLELKGGRAAVEGFVRRIKIFTLAESLGGVESLVCYPAEMTHGSIPPAERKKRGIKDNLIRLSVGIEHIEDLEQDLLQAL